MVDCQRAFVADPTGRGGTQTAVRGVARLAEAARRRGLPVVWLQTYFADPHDLGPVWAAKVPDLLALTPSAAESELHPECGYRPGERVVHKLRASAFFGTGLAEELRSAGHDGILLAGFTTGGCIRASAVDAASHDFLVYVARDAVADRSSDVHDAALRDLESRYAEVGTVEEILAVLDRALPQP